jgi:hypothetical protein
MTSNFEYRYVSMTPEHSAGNAAVTYGTASVTPAARVVGEVDDESIAYQFDLMTRQDVSRYGSAKSVNGKEYSEGGVNLVMQPDDFLGMCLFGIYGDNTSGNSAGYGVASYIHTFKESTDQILPSFTIEVGREENEHTYKGMCMQSLSVSAAHGEYATIAASFTGKSEDSLTTLATPTFVGASVDGFHFAEGKVEFSSTGGTKTEVTTIKSVSLEYNMNLDTDMACSIGNRTYIRKPEPQRREITGSIEFSLPQTSAADGNTPAYETALTTGGALWTGDTDEPAVMLTFTSGSHSLVLKVRKVRWEAPSANISGRDTQTLSMNFVGLVDTADNVMSESILTLSAASSQMTTATTKYSLI